MKYLAAFLLAALLFAPLAAKAGETVTYKDGGTVLEGYLARASAKNAPLVVIVHQWMGLTDYEKMRADMIAKLGYNAFAIDMYGQGVRPKDTDEAAKMIKVYEDDTALARRRANAGLSFARTLPGVDANRVAVIGYCFGGAMALELARSGADVKGFVTFHGLLASKDPVTGPGIIKAPIQVHTGADDPMVKADQVAGFEREMNAANADWTVTTYAHAVHAFTQKNAGNDPSKGVAYNETADKRSWASMQDFLKDLFKS